MLRDPETGTYLLIPSQPQASEILNSRFLYLGWTMELTRPPERNRSGREEEVLCLPQAVPCWNYCREEMTFHPLK